MIITTGKTVRVDIQNYSFSCTSDAPGQIVVTRRARAGSETMSLPTFAGEMEAFVAAYRRAAAEDIEYRKVESEDHREGDKP